MSENIRSTNLRFNLDKDVQNRAWQYLQTMDKKKFKSYSQIIAISLVDYFDRYYKKQDEPYLETREREERFVEQIVTAVENAMNRTLPVYLAGCMVGIAQITPQVAVAASEPEDADLDWDFLGRYHHERRPARHVLLRPARCEGHDPPRYARLHHKHQQRPPRHELPQGQRIRPGKGRGL